MSKLKTAGKVNKLELVETLASKIACPVCLNSRLEVNLSCEVPNSPCDFHAICKHCNYHFVITNETKTTEEVFSKVQRYVIESGCPKCGDQKLNVEFLCDMKSEDCFFIVRCVDNGHHSRLNQTSIQYLFT